MKVSKKEFFKRHNPLTIDEETKPNWQNEKYKYFVIEHFKNYTHILTMVYTLNNKLKTYLLFINGQPEKEFSSIESAYTFCQVLIKGKEL